MVSPQDFGEFETAWCPGCGNFAILDAVKRALADGGVAPHQALFVSGIGQAAKAPHYMRCNLFNGLHGRALPAATGAKLANPGLRVVVQSGDGCTYGEGGNHFLAALRRNIDLTVLVHDNQIYGLTKGQASPTSSAGHVTKAQPRGMPSDPFPPTALALTLGAGFVARGFTGMPDLLSDTIRQAMTHTGIALVDILQQCVSFNRVNTFAWYKKRCYELEAEHDPGDWHAAMQRCMEWGDAIPVGVLYKSEHRRPLRSYYPFLEKEPLYAQKRDMNSVERIMREFQ